MGVYSIVPKVRRQHLLKAKESWLGDERTELAIDSANEFIDEKTQILVLFHLSTCRNGDLYHDDSSNVLRMVSQEHLKCPQLLGQGLDVVQAINADYDVSSFKLML